MGEVECVALKMEVVCRTVRLWAIVGLESDLHLSQPLNVNAQELV